MLQQINAITPLEDARATLADAFDLKFTKAVEKATRPVFEKVRDHIPEVEWPFYAPLIHEINRLKKTKNAVILAHNYQTPQIYFGVADVVGDSLQLAVEATKVTQSVIVQCGVHFMAETSKILNPQKTVLMPDMAAGCSLAESITAEGIAEMRARYPGAPVVSYVNTTAEVKAASDICCTSANAAQIVAAMDSDTVIMTPDKWLAQNVANKVPQKRIVWWDGACIVHEQFTAQDLRDFRDWNPGLKIIAHPECPPDVVAEADYAGSTANIQGWVETERPKQVMLVTECSMASNISDANPEVEFLGPCNMCPYMQKITLEKVLWSLHTMTGVVEVDPKVADRARLAVQRMIDLSQRLAA